MGSLRTLRNQDRQDWNKVILFLEDRGFSVIEDTRGTDQHMLFHFCGPVTLEVGLHRGQANGTVWYFWRSVLIRTDPDTMQKEADGEILEPDLDTFLERTIEMVMRETSNNRLSFQEGIDRSNIFKIVKEVRALLVKRNAKHDHQNEPNRML